MSDPAFSRQVKKMLAKRAGEMSAEDEQAVLSMAMEQDKVKPATAVAKGTIAGQGTREDVAQGLWVQRSAKGLLIGGESLTPGLEARLRAVLKT